MVDWLVILAIIIFWVKVSVMTDQVERLRQDIATQDSAIDSAVTLINGLANQIRMALISENSDEELSALADALEANTAKLATSVAENTAAAEDSDSFYDPSPVGEENETEFSGYADSSEDTDAAEEENTSSSTEQDSSAQPVDDTDFAGEGAISADTAVDTGGNTDSPIYGNGDGSEESASSEGVDNDVSDEGNATDSTAEASSGSSTEGSDESSSDSEDNNA